MLVAVPLALGCSSDPAGDAGTLMADAFVDLSSQDRSGADTAGDAVCEPVRATDGGVACYEENLPPGSGRFCFRYLCAADDGGTTLDGCCRLVS